MTDSVFLHGVALGNYRGVGDNPAYVGPFRRFNFMVGPNNSGKSCVLHFIANHLVPLVCSSPNTFNPNKVVDLLDLDAHQGASRNLVRMGIGVSSAKLRADIEEVWSPGVNDSIRTKTIDYIVSMLGDDELIWLERKSGKPTLVPFGKELNLDFVVKTAPHDLMWNAIWATYTGKRGGGVDTWVKETIEAILGRINTRLPRIGLIPAFREISPKGLEFSGWGGQGLIDELARLQNPGVMERAKIQKFQRINEFLKSVVKNASANIEIPHDREHVLVHMDNKVLPLDSLGTGIHEVVMLAAFCSLMEEQIVCIEEPEIHLHPLLQRRLMRYLQEQTTNQYFIATHSASLIDTPNSAIFHVTNHEGKTKISAAVSSGDKFDICRDLGYRASDLLQANAVVWVEGPSDRIYIRHWIASVDPGLREGIEYSIMFYGGRLLSHLSAKELDVVNDSDVEVLIALRCLNRNLAVVIDSDKTHADAPINATKLRIQNELNEHGGLAWISAGREIENYIPKDDMTAALQTCYGRFGKRLKENLYDHVLPFKANDGTKVDGVDKVKVAKAVCEKPADLDVLDLRDRVMDLIKMIHHANDLA